jgi:hypothetical protein
MIGSEGLLKRIFGGTRKARDGAGSPSRSSVTTRRRSTPEQAASYMTRFCSCGVFNPARARRFLEEVARGESQ